MGYTWGQWEKMHRSNWVSEIAARETAIQYRLSEKMGTHGQPTATAMSWKSHEQARTKAIQQMLRLFFFFTPNLKKFFFNLLFPFTDN